MLVLTRKEREIIDIDQGAITVTVLEIRGDKVRLGIEAPRTIRVNRREVSQQIAAAAAGEEVA